VNDAVVMKYKDIPMFQRNISTPSSEMTRKLRKKFILLQISAGFLFGFFHDPEDG
jgi:hypothetical protein